jgi:hypothetical protein
MRSKKVTNLFSFAILIAVSAIRPDHMSAQQSVSSHFGVSAINSGSKVEVPSSVIGGSSKWAAGHGSFGTGVQTGGVWTDGSTFATSRSITHRTTQALVPDAKPSLPSSNIASGLHHSLPSNLSRSSALSSPHNFLFSSSQLSRGTGIGGAPGLKSSGMRRPVGGSQGANFLRGAGAEGRKPKLTSSIAPELTKIPPARERVARPFLFTQPETDLRERETITLP